MSSSKKEMKDKVNYQIKQVLDHTCSLNHDGILRTVAVSNNL